MYATGQKLGIIKIWHFVILKHIKIENSSFKL